VISKLIYNQNHLKFLSDIFSGLITSIIISSLLVLKLFEAIIIDSGLSWGYNKNGLFII